MKKILSMVAMAVMLFATSCSQEELASVADGTQVPVVFSAQLPQEIATRVYSDGKTAKTLHYAVYVSGTNQTKFQSTTSFNDALQANVELTLATGIFYDFIFWAQSDAVNEVYTLDWEAKTMTVNYNKMKANDETNDAFYAYRSKLKVTGAVKEDIELYRPFAQINLGTKDFDLAEKAGLFPDRSSMTANLPNVLSFVDGSVSGEERVTIGVNTFTTTETFPVTGYEYLEMNYVLTDTVKGLINCTFSIWEKNASAALSPAIEVSNVPVQRNYRTNIYGSLLTDPANFNVEIIPDYNTPDNNLLTEPEELTLEEKLYRAAANGGSVVLDEEVVLSQELVVAEGKKLEIDLNGNELETPGLIIVKGELVIGGKGMGHLNSRLHTEAAGKTTINGGGIYWGRISSDGETLINDIIYNQALEGNVLVCGGSFRDDPSEFVAPGYEAVYEDNRYVVKEVELSEMAKRLYEAAENGGSVVLEEDVELLQDLVVAEGKTLVIEPNGYAIKPINNSNEVGHIFVKGELIFTGEGGMIRTNIHTETIGKTTINSYNGIYWGNIISDGETIIDCDSGFMGDFEGNILIYRAKVRTIPSAEFLAEGTEVVPDGFGTYVVRAKE